MTKLSDTGKMILGNKLIGRWAAEQMGLTGQNAQAYSIALAKDALSPEGSDVFSRVRSDFDAAGVMRSDEQILSVMTEMMIKAGTQLSGSSGASLDASAVALKRNLMSG